MGGSQKRKNFGRYKADRKCCGVVKTETAQETELRKEQGYCVEEGQLSRSLCFSGEAYNGSMI